MSTEMNLKLQRRRIHISSPECFHRKLLAKGGICQYREGGLALTLIQGIGARV
jgi:hypothetical protein